MMGWDETGVGGREEVRSGGKKSGREERRGWIGGKMGRESEGLMRGGKGRGGERRINFVR